MFFCEVESILNDRPIIKLSDDTNDLESLMPLKRGTSFTTWCVWTSWPPVCEKTMKTGAIAFRFVQEKMATGVHAFA